MASEVDGVVKILLSFNLNQNQCCPPDVWGKKFKKKLIKLFKILSFLFNFNMIFAKILTNVKFQILQNTIHSWENY